MIGDLSWKLSIFLNFFRLGTEKYKSKAIKEKSGKFSWMELSSLSLYDDYLLEISIWERDTLIGR